MAVAGRVGGAILDRKPVSMTDRLLYALGDFAWANRADIAAIDVNPIKVLPAGHGAVVVDALIVPSA